ncbi:MAG: type II toxin-antitoxin system VapB family antitoxin [Gammaproteobacteria bacterium]|nr:type II toxin-antitoxin system VapB family antitoxin [Gammaproteobacteria bacterium]
MRTTLTIDDQLIAALKERAHRSGQSFKAVVNEALREGLTSSRGLPKARRYRVPVHSLGAASDGFNLDKALELADALEDEELARKLAMRK